MDDSKETGSAAFKVNSLTGLDKARPDKGRVVWDPARSIWNTGFLIIAIILGPIYFTVSAFAVFLGLSAITLCMGHSVGFHRRLNIVVFPAPNGWNI